jgi:Cu/Ag efflux pump CusA
MTRRILGASLKFRLLVLFAATGLITVGAMRVGKMNVDTYPEFTPPYVEVQTEALGLSASEVESLITVPLEVDLLNGVAWLDTIRSESLPGLSSVFLQFQPGTSEIRARQMVSERLNQPQALPSVGKPPVMLPPLSSTSRAMMIGLSSKQMSLIDVGVLARWTIKPRLMAVPGVANVTIWGHRERQLQVQVDPQRLAANDVSLDQIVSTTGNSLWVSPLTFLEASTPGAGGFFDAPNQRLQVRHESPIIKAGDLGRVAVEPADGKPAPLGANGKPLRLSDVATVVEDHQPLIGDAIVDGKPGVMLVVEKLPDANTEDVTAGVEEALEAMKPGLTGLDIDDSIYRPASYVRGAVHDVGVTMLIGFALMIVALGLLLYRWRTALVAIASMGTAVSVAVLAIYFKGTPFNSLIFAGLIAGLVVVIDEAIIGAESVARRLRERPPHDDEKSAIASVLEATAETRRGLGFAALVIALPLLPVFFLTGLGEAFGRPVALSYLLAIVAAMIVALTLTPALGVLLLARHPAALGESKAMAWLRGRYDRLLTRSSRSPRAAWAMLGLIAIVGLATVPFLKQTTVPIYKERDFLVAMDGPPGVSLPEMQRITTRASNEIMGIPGVRRVGAHVGRAIQSDRVVSPDAAELWVSLDAKADYAKTVAAVRRAAKGYAGIDVDVMTYAEGRFEELGTGADEPIAVRLFGADLAVLRTQAVQVTKSMQEVKGITNVFAELPRMEPTVQVEVNLEKAKAAGIKPGDIRRESTTLLSGVLVGNTFEEQKVFEVIVWGSPAVRKNLDTVRDLLIQTPNGTHVRLGDVASVSIKPSPNIIDRDSATRFLDITAGVHGRSRDAVLKDVRTRLESMSFPLEYHAELVGSYAANQALHKRILVASIAAAIGMFLLLQAALGSWRLATMLSLTLPLALVGGTVAAISDSRTIELGSLLGFLALLALAVRNGVILLKRYQQLERQGMVFGPDLIKRGAGERFAPTVLTAVTTALVFAPFVLRSGRLGHEDVAPMAIVVLGGLVTVLAFGLFILPGLYLRFGQGQGTLEELDLTDLWAEPEEDHPPRIIRLDDAETTKDIPAGAQ